MKNTRDSKVFDGMSYERYMCVCVCEAMKRSWRKKREKWLTGCCSWCSEMGLMFNRLENSLQKSFEDSAIISSVNLQCCRVNISLRSYKQSYFFLCESFYQIFRSFSSILLFHKTILFYHALPNISELKYSKYSKYLSLYEKLKLIRLITRFQIFYSLSFIEKKKKRKRKKFNVCWIESRKKKNMYRRWKNAKNLEIKVNGDNIDI